MLVLSRKAEQEIVIGDCRIKVLSIQGGRVRLGIEAPANVPVHRTEVLDLELCTAPTGTVDSRTGFARRR
jgi:carbon storage regulator